jgi:lysophospholipase L1-like esterase
MQAPWPSGRNFDSPYEPAFKELIQRTNAEWASEAAVGQQSPVRLYHFPTTNLYWKDETFDGLHPTEAAHEKIADALALWCIDSQTKVVEEGPALSAACSAAR